MVKLVAHIAQLVALVTIASKYGAEAWLLALAAVFFNAIQAAYKEE